MTKLNVDEHQDLLRAYNMPLMEKRTIQELHGIAAAIIYDGIVDDNEIGMLTEWLSRHGEFLGRWPLNALAELMEKILEDGVVDADERRELLAFLSNIAATPEDSGRATESIFTENPAIVFPGRSFVFTGKLDFGSRKQAQKKVEAHGGINEKSPVKRLDYLVVGSLGTDHWKYSRYGTKIEKVIGNQRQGSPTIIIREVDFVKAIIG